MRRDFEEVFSGKRVLITGHTGFKGAWLTLWLSELGAQVVGIGLDPATAPSLFDLTLEGGKIDDVRHDIRDYSFVQRLVHDFRPDFVFHLAAQAIVSRSFEDPRTTFETNVMGTVNVLEALRALDSPVHAVMVTSDKAYLNREWVWGYRESDRLGGHDPYSGSKAAAEIALASYQASFLSETPLVRLGIARAGNVIGGGDWSVSRIVPDAVRAWRDDRPLEIRSSQATRPWQHVLEPLSGYLTLAAHLASGAAIAGEAFNFGPSRAEGRSVTDLVQNIQQHLPGLEVESKSNHQGLKEAGLLQLNCEKADSMLEWRSALSFEETVSLTCDWYLRFYGQLESAREVTIDQIDTYSQIRRQRN